MNRSGEHGVVVVGVDGDDTADDALDWAAAEAATRGNLLRIVHAFRPPLPADPYALVPQINSFLPAATTAELVLQDAVIRAQSVASDIDVSTRLVRGSAARALIAETRQAGTRGVALLVVGTHSRSGLRGRLVGSVSMHAATHASCPVVVVRPAGDTGVVSGVAGTLARVVVGVDQSLSCTPAVGFAFEAARQRGIPLTMMHAWSPDPPTDSGMVSGAGTLAQYFGRRTIEKALARWCNEFSDVPVVTELVCADPAQALVAESRGAALLVVGSQRRRHLLGAALGSVSQTVLHHAHCPIAIVHHGYGATMQPPAGMHHGLAS
jgi:nucleotide-binding universal stress UspA family protein